LEIGGIIGIYLNLQTMTVSITLTFDKNFNIF